MGQQEERGPGRTPGEQMLMPVGAIVNLRKRHFEAIAENTNRPIQIPKSSNDASRQFHLTARCSHRDPQYRLAVDGLLLLCWGEMGLSRAIAGAFSRVCCRTVWWQRGCGDVTASRFFLDTKRINLSKMLHKEVDYCLQRVRAFSRSRN